MLLNKGIKITYSRIPEKVDVFLLESRRIIYLNNATNLRPHAAGNEVVDGWQLQA